MKGVKKICSECKIENEPREITLCLERDGVHVEIVGVPAMVCPRCGQEYVAASISKQVLKTAERLVKDLEAARASFARTPTELPFRRVSLAFA